MQPKRPYSFRLGLAIVALIGIVLTTAAVAWIWATVGLHGDPFANQLGAATLVVTAGAFALAALAAIVAILAYAEAIHRPILDQPELFINGMLVTDKKDSVMLILKPPETFRNGRLEQITLFLRILNLGDATARHLFVRLLLVGFKTMESASDHWMRGDGWRSMPSVDDETLMLLWGGREGELAYPGILLRVPTLTLDNLAVVNPATAWIWAVVVADGADSVERFIAVDVNTWE